MVQHNDSSLTHKDTMSLLKPTSNSVELCRNYEYVMYVLCEIQTLAVS